jgi:hypothetical protein
MKSQSGCLLDLNLVQSVNALVVPRHVVPPVHPVASLIKTVKCIQLQRGWVGGPSSS